MPHAPREPSRPPRTPQSLRGESPFQTESAKVDREVLRDATRPLVSTPTTDREVLRDAVRPLVSTPTTGRKGTVASPSETVMFLTASHGTLARWIVADLLRLLGAPIKKKYRNKKET